MSFDGPDTRDPRARTGDHRARHYWLARLIIVAVTCLALGRIALNPFVGWDDPNNFTNNPRLNPPTWSALAGCWVSPSAGLYVPVTSSVWMGLAVLARAAAGEGAPLAAWPFHVASIAAHAAAAVIVFEILVRLLPQRAIWPAAFGALVFALHPVQVEAVAWASGLKDALCGLFSLIAIWQYVRFAQLSSCQEPAAARRGHRLHYFIALGALVLATLCKPTAIVTPAMCGVIDWLLVGRPLRRVVLSTLPMLIPVVPVLIVARIAQDVGDQFVPPLWQRPLVALDALAFYLRKLAVPWPLGLDYGRSPEHVIAQRTLYVTWLVPAIVGAALVLARSRWIGAAFLLLIGGVAPTLGLTPFQFQFNSTVADHYLYLAMFGAALLAAWLGCKLGSSVRSGALAPTLAVVVMAALAGLSFWQAGYWRNDRALFEHALAVNSDSALAHNNLGTWLAASGTAPQEAAMHFQLALRAVPQDPLAHRNLARIYAESGEIDLAIQHLAASLEVRETHTARTIGLNDPEPMAFDHNLLGRMLLSRDRSGEARVHLQRAVDLEPGNAKYAADLNALMR